MIDFCELPKANKPSGHQDTFEIFSRDLLEAKGYKIVQQPGRGMDGGVDFIVADVGIDGSETFRWLVSCKHFAHSKKSVGLKEEIDIGDRLDRFSCNGFIGMYSTVASSPLLEKLKGLKFRSLVFDKGQIETFLIETGRTRKIFARYLPKSYVEYKSTMGPDIKQQKKDRGISRIDRELLVDAAKTAIVLIEIEKIREEYFAKTWPVKSEVIGKLFKFGDHANVEVSEEAIRFLYDASHEARAGMPTNIALEIQCLVLTFFPAIRAHGKVNQNSELALLTAHIGFNLVYDGFVHVTNFLIAAHGLTILKYVFLFARRNKIKKLEKDISMLYAQIDGTRGRWLPDRVEDIELFLKTFKQDLKTGDLSFPPLPDHLYKYLYSPQ